ncbi:MAG: hypothetical protein RIG61_11810 [Deltaproteobacteria bacterium]
MKEDRFKVSSELFRRVLTHIDLLSRDELMEIQAERREVKPDLCSPAFYHMILALEDLARAELVNRDLMGDSED